MDAVNRGAVFVLILASVITGATSHQPKAFTMLYIFVRTTEDSPASETCLQRERLLARWKR